MAFASGDRFEHIPAYRTTDVRSNENPIYVIGFFFESDFFVGIF